MFSETKEYEISTRTKVFWGYYSFDNSKLVLHDCKTHDKNQEEVDATLIERLDVYRKLEIEKQEELNEFIDSLDDLIRESMAEDRADEKRKY